MNLTVASDVSARAPMLSLGVLSMRGLAIREKDDALWQAIEQASVDFAARCGVNAIASDPRVAAVRRLFKAVGVDPSRYRPSSEALVRRVSQGNPLPHADPMGPASQAAPRRGATQGEGVSAPLRDAAKGKGLYQINTAVDVNNWCSLEERLPFGIYDAAHVAGDVLLRLGRENEVYEGIGKSLVSLEGKLLLADARGPFGSPISDSTRDGHAANA